MFLTSSLIRQTGKFLPESVKQRVKGSLGVPTVERCLLNMRKNGFAPNTIIDVGAYAGEWTRLCKQIFPVAHILMVEPQVSRLGELRQLTDELPDVTLAPVLLGEAPQDLVTFHENGSASSVLGGVRESGTESAQIPMTTLADVTVGTEFAQPDFIKLDVQGYELSVLRGGEALLDAAEAVLMEVNLLEIYSGAPLFHQAVAYMAHRGFRAYDICTFFRRPLDGALWQVDMIFVKATSALLTSKLWA